MNTLFTRILTFGLTLGGFWGIANAQTGVLNPNDSVITYNASQPPATPPNGTLAKWVRTVRMSYPTTDFKCYYYNGVQFRLKWPTDWTPGADGRTWPLDIFFHGVGEAGTIYDNEFQLYHGGNVHQAAVNTGKYNGFLLYPQSSSGSGGWSQGQIDAIAQLLTQYIIPQCKVDPNRIGVTGLSGGGDGAWLFSYSHPTLAAGLIPMSSASLLDIPYVQRMKWTPIWLFQGGLDKSPDPGTTQQLVNAYGNAGGNLKYTLFPADGHDTWDDAWKQVDYFPFLLRVNTANPWVLKGQNQFCPGVAINATIGVVTGLDGYQWRKDGVIIPGATRDSIKVTATGTYDCQVKRGTVWSAWSPIPVVISTKQTTPAPTITTTGLETIVEPAPDGTTGASLMVPANYASYVWKRVDSPATLPSKTNILNGATPGQYTVSVMEQFGCNVATANPFTVISANGPNPPGGPVNLLATTTGKTQIRLNWGEGGGSAETQFEVYQALAQAGPYKLVGFSPANVDSFVVSNLIPNTTYFYKVRAINATAGSPAAGPSSSRTQADIIPPTTPGNLHASGLSQSTITLVWNASTDDVGVTAYDIYVNGNLSGTVAGNVTTYQASNLINGRTYSFAVKARDIAGNASPFSNQWVGVPSLIGVNWKYYMGTWTSLPNFYALSAVSAGTLSIYSLSPKTVNFNYGFLFQGWLYFPVAGSYTFRLISGDGSKLYIDVPYSATATATLDNDGVHGDKTVTGSAQNYAAGAHSFAMTYFKSSGGTYGTLTLQWMTPQTNGQFVNIPNSSFVQNAVVGGAVPSAPSNLYAAAATAKKINLTWRDNSSNETGFQVFRSASAGGTYLAVGTVRPGVTYFGDSTLDGSTTYYYKIWAINQSGSSAYSSIASATTLALPGLPAAPGGLSGVAKGPTGVSLSWTNNANNATAVEVWRSQGSNTNYGLDVRLPVAVSYTDTGLTKNTVYYYKVRSVNEGGNSGFSNEISVTTPGSATTTVTMTDIPNQTMVNDTTVVVNLSASSSIAGTAISYSSAGLPVFAVLADNHNGTATLTMKPKGTDLGSWKGVSVTATDAFGGSTTDSFNISVNGRNADVVQVSFNTSNNPVTAAGWNGMNISGATNGASAGSFRNTGGTVTTEGITLTSNFDGAYPTGMNTGNNSGIYPDNVLKNFYFGSGTSNYSFKITGLSAGRRYSLVLYGGYPWSASDMASYGNLITKYTVAGQTQTLNVGNNISKTIQFSGLAPDATGAIAVTVSKQAGSAYCIINDMQIISYDASATALTPPSGLKAIGQNFAVRLNWVNSSDARTALEIWRGTSPYGNFSLLNTIGASVTTYLDANLPPNKTYFYKIREVAGGGQYSGFSDTVGGSVVQYTVNLSLNSQTAGSQPAPWNDINTLLSNGFTLSNMMDMNAQRTGINFTSVRTFTSFNDQLGLTTNNNSGVVPDAVMRTFYYNSQGDTATISITGLSMTQIYNFGFYAGTNYSNGPTVGIYQIGNQVVSLNAYNNTTNMVFINNVKPDSTGTVNISFYTDASTAYAMWTSLTIQGMTSPDVIAADSAGIAGSIASPAGDTIRTSDTAATGLAGSQLVNGKIAAYPNPFIDNVVVTLDLAQGADKFTLVVVDGGGRIMQKQEFSGVPAGTWQQTLNFSRLTKGVYFVQVYGLPGGKTRTVQMVKVNR